MNSVRLEPPKKVLFVHKHQGAAKLQAVKVLVFQKSKVFIGGAVLYENMIHKKKCTILEK